VRVGAAAGLAPVADLVYVNGLSSSGGAVEQFLGTSPEADPALCRSASPIAMLPLGVPQLVLHGEDDDGVPIEVSRRYARAAREAGDDVEFIALEGVGHLEFLDPLSRPHAELRKWLGRLWPQ
jgi:dipeptidyl aminopeptidase/acylaminoacyl peptidase